MKNIRRFAAIGLLAFLFYTGPVDAQTQTQTQQATPAAPPAPANVDPKTLAAAKELVHSLDMNNLMRSIFNMMSKTMLPMIARDNPQQSEQIQKLVMDTVQKTFMAHQDEMQDNQATVYAQMFSYDELEQLKAFNQSAVGQKMLKLMPEMMQRTMILNQSVILKIMAETKRNLSDALKKNGMKVPKEMEL